MAASLASAWTSAEPNHPYDYDIFINHRGPDVKKTFASHLYRRLRLNGFRVFLDNRELQMGDDMSRQIARAIRSASVHVAIFSPCYAESSWCLDELLLILESGAPLIPVYYHVNPTDLRNATSRAGVSAGRAGAYARALRCLEEKTTIDDRTRELKRRYDPNVIESWRNALSIASEFFGLGIHDCDGDEGELVDRVVQLVEKRVRKPPLDVATYPTGLEAKVVEFEKAVSLEQQHIGEAMFVGIVGIGGVGKTTLAKEFFNRRRSYYNRSCFLFGVREIAAKSSLSVLQSKLLNDLASSNRIIDNIDEGKAMLSHHLLGSQALIVLDDVDDVEQLHALVSPVKKVLRSGSLIFVTSRDKDVLRQSGMRESSIYKLTGLDRQNSQELFCAHAFKKPYPAVGFEGMVIEFLDVCNGLPLSLKVFGALLQGRTDRKYWKVVLDRISRILPTDIQSSLKISYDSLDEEEKEIFLDTACFFIGKDRDKAIRIWNGSGWEGSGGLGSLESKCLVEIDSKNCIRMHDHLRDLGRDLADKGHHGRPRRLWRPIDNHVLQDVLRHESCVRGVSQVQRSDQSFEDPGELSNLFVNFTLSDRFMKGVQLLRAEGDCLGSISTVLRHSELLWLCWNDYPYSSLPVWIPTKHLRVLEVSGGELETLWQRESEAPLELRELYVEASLVRVPKSIGQLKHLERIEMKDTIEPLPEEFFHLRSLEHLRLRTRMKSLPDSVWKLTNLQHLDLSGCTDLQKLPPSLGNLRNLKHVSFNGCFRLQMLPDSFGSLIRLNHLSLAGCSNLTISNKTFGNITTLQSLDLSKCRRMEALPPQVTHQWSLEQLILSHTDLKELPTDIGKLSNLEVLKLQCPLLEKLPPSLCHLASLKELTLYFCEKLTCLPDSVGELKQLRRLTIHYAKIEHLPEGLTELDNLENLIVRSCPLREVRFGSLERVGGDLRELKHLDLQGTTIQKISFQGGCCPNLQHLNISFCDELLEVGELPTTLLSLDLHESSAVVKITGLSGLAELRRLDISGCKEVKDLPGLDTLIGLNLELRAAGCHKLKWPIAMNIKRKSCNSSHLINEKKIKS